MFGLRAFILIILALALMFFNHRSDDFKAARSQLSVVLVPLQSLVNQPFQFFQWLKSNFSTQQDALEENARLRARQLLLQAKLQRLLGLEAENSQLRALLGSPSQFSERMLVAQLLDTNLDPLAQQVIVDKGEREGVFVGQPVLDAYGVMGQVVDVSVFSSRVLLITDARSAIPVQNSRNGLRAIAAGTNYLDELVLLHMPATADIRVGDLYVTSGLGGRFPFGYPVAVVTTVKRTGDRFVGVALKPNAHINSARLVVLIWSAQRRDESIMPGLSGAVIKSKLLRP